MLKKKQIDNLAKLCYDIFKLMIGLPILGNVLSEKFSFKALGIGILIALALIIVGLLMDSLEVNNDVRH